nr:unnamed protein product [Callosobruchus analis]
MLQGDILKMKNCMDKQTKTDNKGRAIPTEGKKEKSPEKTKNIQILHQDIHCIRNKALNIEANIDTLKRKPEILCFTEHWLKSEEEQFLKIDSYVLWSCFSRKTMQHGRTFTFIKNTIQFEEIKEVKDMNIERQIECAYIE